MDLEHSFTIPVSPEQAWQTLLDVEQVAPCMPGATVDSFDGEVISGKIKVKVGPVQMTYAGTARFTERDEETKTVVLEAAGKETRGSGTAAATVRSSLQDEAGQTRVLVRTSMTVTGRPAQFGRGVMAEVGGRIIGKFATNLAAQLSAEPAVASASAGTAAAGTTEISGAAGTTEVSGASATPAGTAEVSGASATPAGTAGVAGSGTAAGGSAAGNGGTSPVRTGPDLAGEPVEELNLPVRSYNSLRRQGVHTIGALASRTEQELLAIDGLGPQSVKEIRQRLADRGLSLSSGGPGENAAAGEATRTAGTSTAGSGARTSAADGSGASTGSPGMVAAAGPATAGAARSAAPAQDRAAANGALPRLDSRPPDEDALDLLSVAGLPVLKRVLPVFGLAVIAAVLFGVFRRRRRTRS